MDDQTVLLVGGVIALILAAIGVYRSQGQDMASWAAGVLGAALTIVFFT